MKFLRLHVSGFGRLAGLTIEFGDGLTVIAGPNEAGKSTLVECILRTLFGFPKPRYSDALLKYAPWMPGVPYAATLSLRLDDGRTFEIARDFSKSDVPTKTIEFDTRRPVDDLSGNRSTSPGETFFGIALDVYRAAAVVSAGDLAEGSEIDASRALADRLAKIVGSGGDTSAADAIDHLQKAYREIGVSGPNTRLGRATAESEKADEALRRYRDDYVGFAGAVSQRADLEDHVRDVVAQRARCSAALAAARLRSVRARITAAADAAAALGAAKTRRAEVLAATPAIAARRAEVDGAIEALRAEEHLQADAQARLDAREGDRIASTRSLDAANAALLERRAALGRLDEVIAGHERAAADHPAISSEMLAAFEHEADEVDIVESRERHASTAAAIARQRSRPSPGIAVLVATIGIAALASGWVEHVTAVSAAGIALVATGIALLAAFAGASRKRAVAIAAAEITALEAGRAFESASAALAALCRNLGCTSVAAVRSARTAQLELDRLRAERAAAAEAAVLRADQRDALQERCADLASLQSDVNNASTRLEERRKAAVALFDALSIPPGSLDERVAAYRRHLAAGEDAARADSAVTEADAKLDRALRGATPESLDEDATRYAAECAAGSDPGEYADRPETELDQELGRIDGILRDAERQLEGLGGRIDAFKQMHPIPVAVLEEQAAASAAHRNRLEFCRSAAKTAWEAIERAKDSVHRDFAPQLNDAVARAAFDITGGRYEQAWVDSADFAIRVRAPETGGTVDATALSTGTVEQLQFALRAALAAALGSGERVPILYDDALAHADDQRLRLALEHAATLARRGNQIIFLTQRGDVEHLAAAFPDVGIVTLAGPTV